MQCTMPMPVARLLVHNQAAAQRPSATNPSVAVLHTATALLALRGSSRHHQPVRAGFGRESLPLTANCRGPRRCWRRRGLRCSAASKAGGAVPATRDEGVQQAAAAMGVAVEAACGLRPSRKRKGKAAGGGRRLLVELPVMDTSPANTVDLVQDLVAGLFGSGELTELTVVFADFEAAKVALKADFPKGVDIDYLEEISESGRVRGNIFVVAPGDKEMEALSDLMAKWSGQVALLLNPGWDPFSSLSPFAALQSSFVPIYSFCPVDMRLVMRTVEGCVFKNVMKGSPEDTPWQIFQLGGNGSWTQIGQQNQRPTAENIELAFVNASAASSPFKNPFAKK